MGRLATGPRLTTMCGTCRNPEVGVVRDWNARSNTVPRYRTALHWPGGKKAGACGGSRVEVHPNAVLESARG